MQLIRDFQSILRVSNPAIRELVLQRVQTLTSQGFAVEDVGHFAVINAADTVATIEQHLGVPIIAFELIEELPSCFNMVYVLDQAGTGVEVFVPKEDIDANLLAWCRMHASMPPEETP